MPSVKTAQTVSNLKEAQTAIKKMFTATKTAMDDPTMQMGGMEQLVEKVIEQAEIFVDTAVTAIETVAGEGAGMAVEPPMGTEPPMGMDPAGVPPVETDIQKMNTARSDHENDQHKMAMQKMAQDIDETNKKIDDMKEKEAQMKLAQKYSDLFPVAMRTAKYDEFMSHTASSAILEARLDEATVFMSKPNAVKIAQEEDSIFHIEDLESRPQRNIDTGGKI